MFTHANDLGVILVCMLVKQLFLLPGRQKAVKPTIIFVISQPDIFIHNMASILTPTLLITLMVTSSLVLSKFFDNSKENKIYMSEALKCKGIHDWLMLRQSPCCIINLFTSQFVFWFIKWDQNINVIIYKIKKFSMFIKNSSDELSVKIAVLLISAVFMSAVALWESHPMMSVTWAKGLELGSSLPLWMSNSARLCQNLQASNRLR